MGTTDWLYSDYQQPLPTQLEPWPDFPDLHLGIPLGGIRLSLTLHVHPFPHMPLIAALTVGTGRTLQPGLHRSLVGLRMAASEELPTESVHRGDGARGGFGNAFLGIHAK